MAKTVGLRTARSLSWWLHALAPRSPSGELCFVGSLLGLTAHESSGCSGSSRLFLSVARGWDQRHALLGSRASDPWALKSLSSALVSFDGLRWYVWCSCEGRLRLSCGGSVAARGSN